MDGVAIFHYLGDYSWDVQPTRLEQMQMLRAMLVETFQLKFHRRENEISI
jgi:hypothetical protein